jgi:hypothetical protein
VYTRVAALPPDGAILELETSDPGLAADVTARMDLTGDETRALRVVTLPAPGLPELLTPVSGVADVRRTPAHSAELVTQAICGDRLQPLKVEGDWFLVRMDDTYLGWIRSWHVVALDRERWASFERRARHRVGVTHATVLAGPDRHALPVIDLVVGTPLVVSSGPRRGWRSVELADARTGYLPPAAIERRPARARSASPERLAATGLRLLGTPYVWGGTTPNGFDCSGLIQRIFGLNGLRLPRDSDMQARFGKEKAGLNPGALAAGDLVFFGRTLQHITHVAMVLPDGLILHAYGQVIVNSLDPAHALFSPDLARIWRSTRDPLSPAGS